MVLLFSTYLLPFLELTSEKYVETLGSLVKTISDNTLIFEKKKMENLSRGFLKIVQLYIFD